MLEIFVSSWVVWTYPNASRLILSVLGLHFNVSIDHPVLQLMFESESENNILQLHCSLWLTLSFILFNSTARQGKAAKNKWILELSSPLASVWRLKKMLGNSLVIIICKQEIASLNNFPRLYHAAQHEAMRTCRIYGGEKYPVSAKNSEMLEKSCYKLYKEDCVWQL